MELVIKVPTLKSIGKAIKRFFSWIKSIFVRPEKVEATDSEGNVVEVEEVKTEQSVFSKFIEKCKNGVREINDTGRAAFALLVIGSVIGHFIVPGAKLISFWRLTKLVKFIMRFGMMTLVGAIVTGKLKVIFNWDTEEPEVTQG